jgi:uncharacterized RDD family membrane protein YckC
MTDRGVSPIPREARPYQGHRAGVVTRVAASAIDALVVVAVLLVGYAAFSVARFVLHPQAFTFPPASPWSSLGSGLAVLVVYLAVAWSTTGRTYGGRVMGLRVLDHRGRRLRPVRALLRSLFCAFVPIGLLWCVVSRDNLSVQDLFLRTAVVYDWRPGLPIPPR